MNEKQHLGALTQNYSEDEVGETGVRQTIEERTNLRGDWRREGETVRHISRLPIIPSQEKTPRRVYLSPWVSLRLTGGLGLYFLRLNS